MEPEKVISGNRKSRTGLVMRKRLGEQREMLTPRQLRAARVLIGWSRAELSRRSGVPDPTIEAFEVGKVTDPKMSTVSKLRRTLERAGVVFIDPDQEMGPGLRLREGKLP